MKRHLVLLGVLIPIFARAATDDLTAVDSSRWVKSVNEKLGATIQTPDLGGGRTERLFLKQQKLLLPTRRAADSNLVSARVGDALKAKLSEKGRTRALHDAQLVQVNDIYSTTAEMARVEFDFGSGTPRHIAGTSLASSFGDHDFLSQYRDLFRLEDPKSELKLDQEWTDDLGQTHRRYQQMYAGYAVWARELAIHRDAEGSVKEVFARTIPTPRLVTQIPFVDIHVAELNAIKEIGGGKQVKSPELVIYPRGVFGSRLVYLVTITKGAVEGWQVFVDAINGRVVHKLALHREAGATANASGADLFGTTQSFTAWLENGTHYMLDPTKPRNDGTETPLQSPNPVGDFFVLSCGNTTDCANPGYVTSASSNSGWNATAVSAYLNVFTTYSYYLNTFGRNSIDNANGSLVGMVQLNEDGAFWNGRAMYFGNGGSIFNPLARCLDVAGHEMTHGVIEKTANLVYENQPGALNESLADLFGAMVDRADWLLAEDCTKGAPGYLRSMSNPPSGFVSQPGHMRDYAVLSTSQDHGGVHINSGIPNRAAYLIAEGLSNEGLGTSIGRAQTEQIYYRALTTYLLSYSQFIDLRNALLSAAADLYPGNSAVTNAVNTAFDAVGIVDNGSTPDNSSPAGGTTLNGSDVAAYLGPADGIYDTDEAATGFDVFVQFMNQPYSGYDINQIYGPLNDVAAKPTVPALFVFGSDLYVMYVSSNDQLVLIEPDGTNTALSGVNEVSSIAANRNGLLLAYTSPFASDDNIYVLDLAPSTPTGTSYPIRLQNYQDGTTASASKILFADFVAFNYLDNKIIFDALACTSTASSSCDSGGGFTYWTIGVLNSDGQVQFPFLGATDFDIGDPIPAYNNDRILAFDLIDYSVQGTVTAGTVIYDSVTSDPIDAGIRYQTTGSIDPTRLLGVPAFWGDDTGLALQNINGNPNRHIGLGRFPLNSDFTFASLTPLEMHPLDAAYVRLYRTGTRQTPTLTPSSNTLNFGNVTVGNVQNRTVTLSNNSSADVSIQQITSSNNRYSHNAVPTIVPRGQAVTANIAFTPSTASASNGVLTFVTDQNQIISITLNGTGVSPPPPSGGGGGGGGSIPLSLISGLFCAWLFGLQRRRFRSCDWLK